LAPLSSRPWAELEKARDEIAVPIHRFWEIEKAFSANDAGGHVCPVCQVRFNHPKDGDPTDNVGKQRVCTVCADRRKGRLDEWLHGGEQTIWISEIADENDRVALLTLSLDIEPWLEGEQVDSLRAQSIPEWRKYNPSLTEYWKHDKSQRKTIDNPIEAKVPFDSLIEHVQNLLHGAAKRNYNLDKNSPDLVLANLQEGYRHEDDLREFFRKIVEDRADAPEWGSLTDEDRARWIVHQLFRKLPSPGRVYRFWRNTVEFFDDLLGEFREIAAAHPNRWRTRRLMLIPNDNSQKAGWEDKETYSGRWAESPFELLFLARKSGFLTITNLARCFQPQERKDVLVNGNVELKGDDGVVQTLVVEKVEEAGPLGGYAPVIPLDCTPRRFRVLVPLDRATECIETAIARWQEAFGRVWDRMPLRVGVVAFPRLTPFQAVIEAARNLEAAMDTHTPKRWRMLDAHTRSGVTALTFDRAGQGKQTVLIPTTLPDGREDVFYPYMRVEDREVRYPKDFQHPSGRVYRHVRDLRPGDGVEVNESLIACVFLDTTARRFEPATMWPLADFYRMCETWMLLERTAPSLTALRGAWAELAERRDAWCDPDDRWLPGAQEQWLALVRAVLKDRLQVTGAALEALVDAAREGILEWAMEWHLTWLKERF